MTRITSLQNPRIKAAARLRDRRHRDKQGRILIDGARELGRAIQAGVRLAEVFVCPPACQSDEARRVLEMLGLSRPAADSPLSLRERAGVRAVADGVASHSPTEVFELAEAVLEKLAYGERCDGLLAVAETPQRSLDDLRLPDRPLVAVLEGVEKPGNVGAVLRSADAAGVCALIVADPRTDLYNPNTIRASLGTVFTVPTAVAPAGEAAAWLERQGLSVFAARVDGAILYTEADLRGPAAIVLGSEAQGLSPQWSGGRTTAVRLPMRGAADSLNVSAAAAVLFYEALRQRAEPRHDRL